MANTIDPIARKDLEDKLRSLGGVEVGKFSGPSFKEVCLRVLKMLYPKGVADPRQHADVIWNGAMFWFYCLYTHRNQANQSYLLNKFKNEMQRLGLTGPEWKPDASWKWW